MKTLGMLVVAVLVCGCSPQKDLARRLASADRLVVTNRSESFRMVVTDLEVKQVVRAIADGKKESPYISASPYLQLEFFKGTTHLASVTTSVQVFWIGNKPYSDPSGALVALMHRYREEQTASTP
jgi:hypothetical protein